LMTKRGQCLKYGPAGGPDNSNLKLSFFFFDVSSRIICHANWYLK
jgi:hypothetical protein